VATRLKDSPVYKDGMTPGINMGMLGKKFKPGEWVFIGYMGDVSCQLWDNIQLVLDKVWEQPEVNFYIQSKAPDAFTGCEAEFPVNVVFGTTLETNRDYKESQAPAPHERYKSMLKLRTTQRRLMVSIEPVMDFDLEIFTAWIQDIRPERVFLGADNYGNGLPEPTAEKLSAFIGQLKDAGIEVIEKQGLTRLL